MKLHSLEEITDKHIGMRGTPARNEYEASIEEYLVRTSTHQTLDTDNLYHRGEISEIETKE